MSRLGFSPADICLPKVSQQFFRQGGSINFLNKRNTKDKFNILSCSLQNALNNKNINLANFLMQNGASIKKVKYRGMYHLLNALDEKDLDFAKFLIKNSADININLKKSGWHGKEPAPYHRNLLFHPNLDREIVTLLIEHGAYINARDKHGRTPLFYVIDQSVDLDLVTILIKSGADVNAQDNLAQTPLFQATNYGSKDIAKLLIEQGANVNAQDNSGNTPLFKAISYTSDNGYTNTIKLLILHGADIHARNNFGQTPLSEAVIRNNKELVKLLIDNNSNTNYLNYQTIKKIYSKLSNQEYQQIKDFLENNQFKSQSIK